MNGLFVWITLIDLYYNNKCLKNANRKKRSKWTGIHFRIFLKRTCFNKSNGVPLKNRNKQIKGFNRKLMYIFVLNGDRSPRWAWRPYLYRWGFISSAGAKQLSPCWRLRLFPFRRLEVHPKHDCYEPFTRPFLELYVKKINPAWDYNKSTFPTLTEEPRLMWFHVTRTHPKG